MRVIKINTIFPLLILICLIGFITSCSQTNEENKDTYDGPLPPEWAVNATIYEVNIRQYSKEGTFKAFTEDIPRLKDMGVMILWLMPIHPIGEENRKGTLGSYYSVYDYMGINPEFGTKEDFQNLVQTAHEHNMKVIIDWVANHTSWDAIWTQTNPEYYKTDDEGNFMPPVEDWEDVIQLDVENRDMWEAMIQSMEYWVSDFDIDGFRADVAYMLPTEFWVEARQRLEEIKPVFMLAEAEEPELHRAFDMSYTWGLAETMRAVGSGEASLSDLDDELQRGFDAFHKRDYRMVFTTNHDENSWKGSDRDLYGENFENFAVFAATVWGMPLIYNGQEAGLNKQLEFFEKDEIDWDGYQYQEFYKTLLELNTWNQALFNGELGGDYKKLKTDNDDHIFAYQRRGHHEQVMVILNFSDDEQTFRFEEGDQGEWTNVFNDETVEVTSENTLGANSYLLLERVYMNH